MGPRDRTRPRRLEAVTLIVLLAVTWCRASSAEEPTARALSIEDAITFAIEHHPALKEQSAIEEGSVAQIALARAGYLPLLDLSLQLNRGTGNVLRGSLFGMRGIPAVSGPPSGRNLDGGAFGSALGVSASWDVLGLMQRVALVDAALAERDRAHAGADARKLAIAFAAADSFLSALARAETVKAAGASVDRARIFATQVKALVDQSLRPGADLSRAQAELALASTQLIRAQQAAALGRIDLAQNLGIAGALIEPQPGRLLALPPNPAAPPPAAKNPLITEAEAATKAAQERKRAVDLQYLPRLDLAAALWARGSGLNSGNGVGPSGADGLDPDTPNWAGGAILTWPALETVAIRARARAASADVKARVARRDVVVQAVQSQIDSARAILEGAVRVAQNTPVALESARTAEKQATARYRAGLATVLEVAEAQRLLAQAEIDDAEARLAIWSAKLLLARSIGDLEPFLSEQRR